MNASLGELGLAAAAGGLTTLSPCVFPVLPLVVGGAVQAHRYAPVAMGVGMAASFAVIGVAVGVLGPALDIDPDAVRLLGAGLLVALGIVMLVPQLSRRFSSWMLPLASTANTVAAKFDPASLLGAVSLGALLGLVWSPCSGPLLASALTLVANSGGALRGGLILGMFGLGAALPLVAVAYASRSGIAKARGWMSAHVESVKKMFGAVVLLAGAAILTGADKWAEARVVALLPDGWLRLTTLF